jgi:hypothetical protein
MSILDVGKPRVDVFLLRIRFSVGENAIQIRRVGFVLPMMLERVDVDVMGVGSPGGRLEGRRHS